YLNYIMYPENGYRYMNINFRNPALQDKAVRQALAYGLNREKIISSVFGKYAKVVNVPQAEASWSYSAPENNYEFDPEKAKKLLDDAGWVPGADGIREKDGMRLSFHFLARTSNPLSNSILAVAPDNYKDIGIEFTSESLDFSSMLTKLKAHGTDWDLCCLGWSLTADPNAKTIFVTDGAQNDGNYSDAKVDELFDKITKEFDRDKLKELYKELYKELNEDLPYVYMYQGNDFYVYNGRVKNLTITPYERYTQHLHEATLE
ncbi:MAG: ABC transporter substrate-binding protein, partial [Clostridium sp.]